MFSTLSAFLKVKSKLGGSGSLKLLSEKFVDTDNGQFKFNPEGFTPVTYEKKPTTLYFPSYKAKNLEVAINLVEPDRASKVYDLLDIVKCANKNEALFRRYSDIKQLATIYFDPDSFLFNKKTKNRLRVYYLRSNKSMPQYEIIKEERQRQNITLPESAREKTLFRKCYSKKSIHVPPISRSSHLLLKISPGPFKVEKLKILLDKYDFYIYFYKNNSGIFYIQNSLGCKKELSAFIENNKGLINQRMCSESGVSLKLIKVFEIFLNKLISKNKDEDKICLQQVEEDSLNLMNNLIFQSNFHKESAAQKLPSLRDRIHLRSSKSSSFLLKRKLKKRADETQENPQEKANRRPGFRGSLE